MARAARCLRFRVCGRRRIGGALRNNSGAVRHQRRGSALRAGGAPWESGCAAPEIVSSCDWLSAAWPTEPSDESRERVARWVASALGEVGWSNAAIARACVAANARVHADHPIDARLALAMCRAADMVSLDEAAPERGVAAAYALDFDVVKNFGR